MYAARSSSICVNRTGKAAKVKEQLSISVYRKKGTMVTLSLFCYIIDEKKRVCKWNRNSLRQNRDWFEWYDSLRCSALAVIVLLFCVCRAHHHRFRRFHAAYAVYGGDRVAVQSMHVYRPQRGDVVVVDGLHPVTATRW